MIGEFEVIEQYFAHWQRERSDVALGIGDDAALLNLPESHHLVVTTDLLLPGVHFPEATLPEDIAHKALAVNLSDLAAMGARPLWYTLSLSLPKIDPSWLSAFAGALAERSQFFHVSLVGGDTNQGPLAIGIQAMGQVPREQALKRSGCRRGDWIYATGTLGDAALGLAIVQGRKVVASTEQRDFLLGRLNRPEPRLAAGIAMRQRASAAIDVSDGLYRDLGHMLKASGNLGAMIDLDALPLSRALDDNLTELDAWEIALSGGDDYELCFTVADDVREAMETTLENSGIAFAKIGRVTGNKGIVLMHGETKVNLKLSSYEHFSGNK